MTKFTVLALLASVIAAPAFAAPLATGTGTVETKKESTVTTTAPVADAKVIGKTDAKIANTKAVPAKPLTIAGTPAKVETKTEVKSETKEAK